MLLKYGLIGALGAALVAGAYWSGKAAGTAERDISAATALQEWHAKETELLAKLQKADAGVKIIYRTRDKIIENASHECLDALLPADIVNSLQ